MKNKEKLEKTHWSTQINVDPEVTEEMVHDAGYAKMIMSSSSDPYYSILSILLKYRDKVYVPNYVFKRTDKLLIDNDAITEVATFIINLRDIGYDMRFNDLVPFISMNTYSRRVYMDAIYTAICVSYGLNYHYQTLFKNFADMSKKSASEIEKLYEIAIHNYMVSYGYLPEVISDLFDPKYVMAHGDILLDLDTDDSIVSKNGVLDSPIDELISVISGESDDNNYKMISITTDLMDTYEIFENLLASNSTLSADMKVDIERYLTHVYKNIRDAEITKSKNHDPDMSFFAWPVIKNKETLAFVASYCYENELGSDIIKKSINNGTDVLRIYAVQSGCSASLYPKPKFENHLNATERRFYLDLCLAVPHLYEDASRESEMWKRVFERIKPERYAKKYPSVKDVADKIRSGDLAETPNAIIERTVERGMIDYDHFKEGLKIFEKFPSQFIRYFDSYVRHYGRTLSDDASVNHDFMMTVNSELHTIVKNVESTKMLFTLLSYYARKISVKSQELPGTRYVTPNKAKRYVAVAPVKDNLCNKKYLIDFYDQITKIIIAELTRRFTALPWLGNIYIDEDASGCTVPTMLRDAESTGLNIVGSGSSFKFPSSDDGEVKLMGYIHWTNPGSKESESQDIDLSATFYDENYGMIDSCSYLNLVTTSKYSMDHSIYAVHSGDMVNGGPKDGPGATEAVLISVKRALEAGVRYALITIHDYTMNGFANDNTFFGFQYFTGDDTAEWDNGAMDETDGSFSGSRRREDGNSPKIDPKKNIFISNIAASKSTNSLAMVIVDLKSGYATWVDTILEISELNRMNVSKADMDLWKKIYASDEPLSPEEYVKTLRGGNNVYATSLDQITQLKALIEKPKLFCADLLALHAMARGRIVTDPDSADLIYTLSGSTYDKNKLPYQEILTPAMVDRWLGEFLVTDNKG